MGSESSKLFAFTTSLLESLKSNGVLPHCNAHDDEDGLDGEDVVWISRCLVDDVFNDGEVEKAVSLFMQKQVEIIVIIGQEKSDFKTNFLNHLHLSGKPGERVFKISSRGSFSEISESSVNSVMQLVH